MRAEVQSGTLRDLDEKDAVTKHCAINVIYEQCLPSGVASRAFCILFRIGDIMLSQRFFPGLEATISKDA